MYPHKDKCTVDHTNDIALLDQKSNFRATVTLNQKAVFMISFHVPYLIFQGLNKRRFLFEIWKNEPKLIIIIYQ
jgi:hypothetical protein